MLDLATYDKHNTTSWVSLYVISSCLTVELLWVTAWSSTLQMTSCSHTHIHTHTHAHIVV